MLAWDWRTVTHRHLGEGSFERMAMLGSVTYSLLGGDPAGSYYIFYVDLAPNCFSLKSEISCSVPFIKADSAAAEGMQAGKRRAQDYRKLTAGVA